MRIKPGLSKYKLKKMATHALANALRLHFDSILLFRNGSYPTAFQISVLVLEEFAKAKEIEHYYWSSITNSGFPDEAFEREWLELLYLHPWKQTAFFARDLFSYSPTFMKSIEKRQLEIKKQRATYVGLEKLGRKINTASRISTPFRVSEKAAKK
jgi:AbiV family abortive infection protein